MRLWFAVALVLAAPASLAGQDGPGNSAQSSGPVIGEIRLDRYDIFDSVETRHWYARVGNALHIMTQKSIVERELLFKPGEPYDSAKVAETARNLRQLGLFRAVKIDSMTTDSGLVVRVVTKDGWTTKIDLRFRSTGGQTDYGLTLSENNVLGTGTKLLTRYRHTPDRSTLLFQFRQPRFIARNLFLNLAFEPRSDGNRGFAQLERPFYSLTQPFGIGLVADGRNERVLQFRSGSGTPADSLHRRYLLAKVDGAKALYASSASYLRAGVTAQVRRDDFVPQESSSQTPNTVTGAIGLYLEYRRTNFVVTKDFVGQGRDEDVDVSRVFRLSVAAAPKAFGYDRDGVGPSAALRFGVRFPSAFAFLDARANGLFSSAGLDSGSVTVGGTLVLKPLPGQVAILHADAGRIKRPVPGSEFDLGFALGPRAFPIHAFTGDREFFLTGEYRATVVPDLFHLASVAVAGFADHGGAWYGDQGRRTGSDIGFGLRIGQSRVAELDLTRIDFAYRFGNGAQKPGWIIVVAKGIVFSTTMRP